MVQLYPMEVRIVYDVIIVLGTYLSGRYHGGVALQVVCFVGPPKKYRF